MFKDVIGFIKNLYPGEQFIPLHAPVFMGNEKKYVDDCIDSTYVSSVGEYVNKFEAMICDYTKAKYAVATTNGTSALHMGLLLLGVTAGTEVLTQALSFVATANAISYLGASPIFIDSAEDNLGMCPVSLRQFLEINARINSDGQCINKLSGNLITACVPMHVFGQPVKITEIIKVCREFHISLLEDAAESVGSFVGDQHTGLVGEIGVLSFNGNKIVTCGGGGMIITNNKGLALRAKHLTTTAKVPHKWEFYHDEVGYNYRLPNLNAALACAQMELLPKFVENKRQTASEYRNFFSRTEIRFLDEAQNVTSNFWLNAIQLQNRKEVDAFLEQTNNAGVMTRPVWQLMTDLPAFKSCQRTPLTNAQNFVATVVNIPSSVRGGMV